MGGCVEMLCTLNQTVLRAASLVKALHSARLRPVTAPRGPVARAELQARKPGFR